MKSDVITVHASGSGVKEALTQTEKIAEIKGLSQEDQMKLRLLTEEMMGMLQGLTGEVESEFFIEEENKDYVLHLSTNTEMYAEKRQRLVEATTDNRNAAAVGITGKLRNLFESMLEPKDAQTPSVASLGSLGAFSSTGGGTSLWTLSQYRDQVQDAENAADAWDELEKSVVAKLADEVCIGIRGKCVEMTIHKKF